MTATAEVGAPLETSDADRTDERIAHRGPVQRWLISPEIGALAGAVIVWAFFWGNGKTFGNAGSTLNWLDVAAPTGIMAVGVALLMIGGEFDLSSGTMTGASAIMVGLFSGHFMGEGVNIGWAIGAAFLTAIAIGWFNGTMVNKTGLPSFIVTLATFFVLQGVMLVITRRLALKVQVEGIDERKGYGFFKSWIAHEWTPEEFDLRDNVYVTLVAVGVLVFVVGLCEQAYRRRSGFNLTGVAMFVVGVAVALFAFSSLLHTDGVNDNVIHGTIGGLGLVMAVVGLARSRWHGRTQRLTEALPSAALTRLGIGVAAFVLALLVPLPFDRGNGLPILTWAKPGIRTLIAVAAAALGITLSVRALLPSLRSRRSPMDLLKNLTSSAYAGLVVMCGVLAVLQLSTVQALRAVAMMLLGGVAATMFMSARGIAGKHNTKWQLIIGVLMSAAVVAMALRVRADSDAVKFRTGMVGALVLGAVAILANTVLEYVMDKRTVGHSKADKLGRRLQFAGVLLAVTGQVIRLIYTNPTAERAAQMKADGIPVAQAVLRQTVVWWILITLLGTLVLTKSKWGNWIFAVGGNRDAARAIGVPANKVKVGLFMTVSVLGCLAGTLVALRYGTVQANYGVGLEFEFIIAAVIGGNLLTGGYGSVVGASIGASIMAMSGNGIQVTGWDYNGRFAFLGGVLLLAVLVNNYTRKKALQAR